MTDFKTALPVIFAQFTSSATGTQFQLTCNICPDSHKTQVWLCFLVLSLLTMSTSALSERETEDVLNCLEKLKVFIEDSDAMLYAPSIDEIKTECANLSLKCYLSELGVVFYEKRIDNDNTNLIYHLKRSLEDLIPAKNPVRCPPCETYPTQNITIFLARLKHLLEFIANYDGSIK